jgi:hypothetical protein
MATIKSEVKDNYSILIRSSREKNARFLPTFINIQLMWRYGSRL